MTRECASHGCDGRTDEGRYCPQCREELAAIYQPMPLFDEDTPALRFVLGGVGLAVVVILLFVLFAML